MRIMVWDTAGQEEFDAITKAYYRGAQVRPPSFISRESSKNYIFNFLGISGLCLNIQHHRSRLIRGHSWLEAQSRGWVWGDPDRVSAEQNWFDGACSGGVVRSIKFLRTQGISFNTNLFKNSEEVEELSAHLKCRLIRTSVKEDVNVSLVFRYLATKCYQLMNSEYTVLPSTQPTISEFRLCSISFLSDFKMISYLNLGHLNPTFQSKGTIVLRPTKKLARKRLAFKKCGILWYFVNFWFSVTYSRNTLPL